MRRRSKILLALGALMLLPVLAYAAWAVWIDLEYEAALDAIRAAGEPVDTAELEPEPIPDSENCAAALRELSLWLEEHERGDDEAVSGAYLLEQAREAREFWEEEDWAAARAYVDSLEQYYERLARALRERDGWFVRRDWSFGPSMKVPDLDWIFSAAISLGNWSVLKTDTERAITEVLLYIELSERIRTPFWLGWSVKVTVLGISATRAQELARDPDLDVARFRSALDGRLASVTSQAGPPRLVFVQDRAFALSTYRGLLEGRSTVLGGETVEYPWWSRPWLKMDAVFYLDQMRRFLESCDGTPAQTLRELDRIDQVLDGLGHGPRLHGMFLLACRRSLADHVHLVATLRLTRVVLALAEHRQETGEWPERLEAIRTRLGGAVPENPYSTEPFAYERTEGGVRVWGDRGRYDTVDKEYRWELMEEAGIAWSSER